MRINQKLNLVVPLYDEADNVYAYVHSAPIRSEVFQANFWLISKTYAAIYEGGLSITAGPRVAALVLKDIARSMSDPPSDAKAENFLTELRRLSTAIIPNDNGWEPVPYDAAVKRNMISDEDATEVDSAIVFFTVASAMLPRTVRRDLIDGAAQMWGAQQSLLSPTEWIEFLTKSTSSGNTGNPNPQ